MRRLSLRPATALIRFILDNSLLLLIGAVVALVWANVHLESYTRVTGAVHFYVNDVAMVFFFALAMKEVVEAMLPGGPLGTFRQAGVPVLAAVGGMAGPATMYLLAAHWLNRPDIYRGWAIPCATDIAFSYLAARLIFRPGHPAIPFLLLLAIADDALGLITLAVFYPSGPVAFAVLFTWLAPAMLLAWMMRRAGVGNSWAYILGPGLLSWIGLARGGIHPALAMVPIVPLMPHEKSDLRIIGSQQTIRLATLQEFEAWWRLPVQLVLLAFGFVNAGVPFSSVGAITWLIAGSLVLGKPIGIVLTTFLAERVGFRRAEGLDYRSITVLSVAAGIGFTVALFFTSAAFPPGALLDEAKMGALFSFFAAGVAIALGRVLRVR